MEVLEKLHVKIEPPDAQAMLEAAGIWKSVCKPLGSLGLLEKMVIKLAGVFGTPEISLDKRCAVVVCADNGVVAEGVTQATSEVTSQVAVEIAEGKSNINIMAKAAGIDTYAVDVGMKEEVKHPNIICKKIANGTKNIALEPAMTREQALQGIQTGIELVGLMKKKGYQIMVTGEMGIGNTTTSSAIAAVLLNKPVEEVTGRGAGLTSEGLERKIRTIKKAIERNKPNPKDAVDVLQKLGGYDMAAMTGMFLGGGIYRMPIVIDGLISSISALLAQQIHPLSKEYMFASHMTEEPAGIAVMEKLGLQAIIYAQMRLGEGTGAVCLLPILDIALAEYHDAHRFANTEIEQYQELV